MSVSQLPQMLQDLREKTQKMHMDGDRAAVRPLYEQYLAAVPGDPTMWTNLGALLRAEGLHDMALHCQRRAYALNPDSENIINNLANIAADTGHVAEALKLRAEILARNPNDPNMMAMLGKAMRTLRRERDAIEMLKQAKKKHPDYTEITIQLALTQLAAGDYAEGFVNFEKRWDTDELTPRNITQPKWDGGSLEGKSIMVLPEQGFGDGIAMARFLPVLRQFNPARVMLAIERPVERLEQNLDGVDWAGKSLDPGDSFDVWTNIMDLPRIHFEQTPDVPAPATLNVPAESKHRARTLLGPYGKTFNVGVVWTGSLTYRGNAVRSFSHREFHTLLDVPNVQLFSLYKGPKLDEFRADGTSHVIVDAGATEADFADTAGMMQELDLIITSDTATAHLAGSLGVPVWTLLHWDAFWMWQLKEKSTPWYPTMRLYRQPKPRDWDGVFAKVKADLKTLAAARKS